MENEEIKEIEKTRLKAISELEYRSKRLKDRFDYKTEETQNKEVSLRNKMDFDTDIQSLLSPANELKFITIGDNQDYAEEIFKSVQKCLVNGNKIILNSGTNFEMNELLQKEMKKILDYVYIIKENEDEFKNIVKMEKHFFDESIFIEIAKRIKISNDSSIFVNELNGGDIALQIKEALVNPRGKEVFLYGIDRDIDYGAESRDKGIETARGGIYEASSLWADISFCANHLVSFEKSFWDGFYNSELYDFYRRKVMRNKGIFIFNYPFYRVDDIKNIIRNNELLFAFNTGDQVGNIVFVMRYGISSSKSKNEIQKIEFFSERMPKDLSGFSLDYFTEKMEVLKTFRGKYIDIDDIKVEFKGQKDSSEFLFGYFKPKNKLQNLGRPLMEYKPGHIPAMATSEIINGRYVDEVLKEKVGMEFEFDHLFSTKIVKREIEEKETKIDSNGNKIVEISEKKSNVIVSIALTADGEYIELFSNAEDAGEKK